MTDEQRPDPDVLLAAVQKEEEQAQHGKLKIFLGMAAGVGKTYAMLESAQQRKAEGVDVVIGYVELHGRAETERLLKDMEIIPRQKIEYQGKMLEEMDIDAILKRKPALALVDELAHTNVIGARHPKRYQDVLELLDAGIDVYTTVNVQHFESRTDAVRQITGITVYETVPDSLLDAAYEVELIDLPPEELRKRLAEGKIYTPERAELAAHNFFREGNLTALREMALRLTAERVDHELQDYRQLKRITGTWKALDRLMVAVSPSPLSERLVRWTRRMAHNLEAPWIGVYVESPRLLGPVDQRQLTRNLELVAELGGEPITTSGTDVIESLMRVAHQQNVTQIVVGKPLRTQWQELLTGGSLVNRLVRVSENIDIYVVTGDVTDTAPHSLFTAPRIHSGLKQYLIAVIVVAAMLAFSYVIRPLISYQAVAVLLLFTVLVLGLFVGRGPVLMAATLSAIFWDFLFIPPLFTFNITKLEDALTFALYFIIALITGTLTARVGEQERYVRQREERTQALYDFTRETAGAGTLDGILRTAVDQIGHVFNADVLVLLRDTTDRLAETPHPASTLSLDDKERAVAIWAFSNNKIAGRFTDTLPSAQAQYLPLATPGGAVGILGIRLRKPERLTLDQEALLETFVNQVALAVERAVLDKAAARTAILEESERLYSTLLNSISHELRTPLATIAGASSVLLDENVTNNPQAQKALSLDIQDATERLNRLVDNLLDMTRLESGKLKLNLEWCDVSDLINESVKRVKKELADHDLIVEIPPDLPLVKVDFVLIEQALVNLLHNAASYTPPGTRVRVMAKAADSELLITVADRGKGLPPEDVERVFEKFYRAPGSATGGTGLGLSITRGLVEAHGGTITAENRPTRGGARFLIRLPLQPAPETPPEKQEN